MSRSLRWARLALLPMSLLLMASLTDCTAQDAYKDARSIEFSGGGTLRVKTVTTGEDPDPDGYLVSVENVGPSDTNLDPASYVVTPGLRNAYVDDSITGQLKGLPSGSYTIELTGLAANCTLVGENPRTRSVTISPVVWETFDISCDPVDSRIIVRTSTFGTGTDADGYLVTVDGNTREIGPTAEVYFINVAAGPQTVFLQGVDDGCAIVGSDLRNITLVYQEDWYETFEISCEMETSQVAGTWDLDIMNTGVEGDGCDLEDYPATIVITQTGQTVTVTGLGGDNDPWSGTISGNVLIFDGTRPEDTGLDDQGNRVPGLTTAEFTMQVSANGLTMVGSEDWTWGVAGDVQCSVGTSSVSGVRVGAP